MRKLTQRLNPRQRKGILGAGCRMGVDVNYPVNSQGGQIMTAPGGLFPPFSALARERKTWSFSLLPGVLWRALTNISAFFDVLQLVKHLPFSEAARLHPRFAFKYLTHDYLVQTFTVPERACCFLHHHRRLQAVLPDHLLRQTLSGEIMIHQIARNGHSLSFSIGLSRLFDKEGEMSLNLHLDGNIIFLIAFTIIPGWVLKSSAPEVVLITRVQGMKGCHPQIKQVQESFCDVSPRSLLLASLQGLAEAFGIGEIAGVCATNQSSYCEESAASLFNNYDSFFADAGMTKSQAGFYASRVPFESKPIEWIKRGHKLRTKQKRAFKRQIQSACAEFFKEFVPVPAPEPEAETSRNLSEPVSIT